MDEETIKEARRRFAITRYFLTWQHYANANHAIAEGIEDFIKIYKDLESRENELTKKV